MSGYSHSIGWCDFIIHQENMSVKCIPPQHHFYIEKLGFAGVYLIVLFLIQNIHVSSDEYPQCMLWVKMLKNQNYSNEFFTFFLWKPEDQWSCKRSPETQDIYQ